MHLRSFAFIIYVLMFMGFRTDASDRVVPIHVKSQAQFEAAIAMINNGEAVTLVLHKGDYTLSNHIQATAPLYIKGKSSVIKLDNECYRIDDAIMKEGDYYVCRLKSRIPAFSLFLDSNDCIIPISESVDGSKCVNLSQKIIGEFARKSGCEIRIPLESSAIGHQVGNIGFSYGYFDCGWTTGNFEVTALDSEYIHGRVKNILNTGRFDYEKSVYKHDVRFVIFNAERQPGRVYYNDEYVYIPKDYKKVYVLKNTSDCGDKPTIQTSSDLILDGVAFKNFNGIQVNIQPSSVCLISNCVFENTLGNTLSIKKIYDKTSRICEIDNCVFSHCSLIAGNVVHLTSNFSDTICMRIKNCAFNRYDEAPIMYKNTSGCIYVNADAEISCCTIRNTPRCHLYLAGGNIVVKGNKVFNTDGFNKYRDRNLSNDFGLVYCDHITSQTETAIANTNNRVLIDGCLLFGAEAHANDARGIMIDDGRGDVICRNNIVLDCQGYSIDSREVKSFIGSSSIRNVFENNVLGNRYRLAGGDCITEEDRPQIRNNILLGDYKNIVNEKTNVEIPDSVITMRYSIKEDLILVRRSEIKQIKTLPSYGLLKRLVIIK